jgi:trehalose 6-phosphate synthase
VKRLVVVSNRLPALRHTGPGGEIDIPAGGMAAAVFAALRNAPESLWLGWHGRTEAAERVRRTVRHRAGRLELVGLPLTQREVADYYHGFCNAGLWPLFHCFQGRVRLDLEQEACYRGVQERFARTLLSLLRPGDLVWVHDYHFLLLGRELRRLGWGGRIGFFLHIPFPPHDLLELLPDPRDVLEAMLHYDLVGFQVRGSLDNYVYACRRQVGARVEAGHLVAAGRAQRAGVYPVGIDPDEFLPPRDGRRHRPGRGVLSRVVRGRRLLLGVDRLDYTKGIPERILAYETFLERHPQWRKRVSFVQIASPTRTAAAHYLEQKRIVEALVGRINGELAEHDWVPIRYLYRSYPRATLARFYREADVGLVTPLRDGMNLVAKEFVAAQPPESPGVLVLSRTAGAAEDLPEAILVNPCIPADVAAGIARALEMPIGERAERHRALLERVRRGSIAGWGRAIVRDLAGAAGPLLEAARPEDLPQRRTATDL